MYVPCTKCGKPADLQETKADRTRVFLCRDEEKTIPYAFKPHSLVVIGGRHSWLPTRAERWRHALEAAGHFVVLVDPSELFQLFPRSSERNTPPVSLL